MKNTYRKMANSRNGISSYLSNVYAKRIQVYVISQSENTVVKVIDRTITLSSSISMTYSVSQTLGSDSAKKWGLLAAHVLHTAAFVTWSHTWPYLKTCRIVNLRSD